MFCLLPGVLEAMVSDRVTGFPALRPHQRHAWHAFLAQLGVLALVKAGYTDPPHGNEEEWRELLRNAVTLQASRMTTLGAWWLRTPASPAFMQCPATEGSGRPTRNSQTTPDDLDLARRRRRTTTCQVVHRASHAEADDWVFALIDASRR